MLELFQKFYRNPKPEYVAIMGERNSGTNFLRKLLKENTDLVVRNGYNNCWKHGFIREKAASDRCLVVFVLKDPYSYVLSLYNTPHEINFRCIEKCNRCDLCVEHGRLTLSQFMRHEYYSIKGEGTGKLPGADSVGQEVLTERNFNLVSRPRYENALRMLSDKYANWLSIRELASNTLYIRFEDLISQPEGVLGRINSHFPGKPVRIYKPITKHTKKGTVFQADYYLEKRYMAEFNDADRSFVDGNFNFPYDSLGEYISLNKNGLS